MRDLLTNIVLALAATVVGLVAAEAALRAYEQRELNPDVDLDAATIDLARLNYNDEVVERSKPVDEFRVLSFGDSFGYTTVRYPYTYHALAAAALEGQGTVSRARFVNLSESSIAYYQYMGRYRFWAAVLDHDAVLFNVYLGNDVIDVALGHVPDETALNATFRGIDRSAITGVPRVRIPARFGLRLADHLDAVFLMLRGEIATVSPDADSVYTAVAGDLSESAYYASALAQLDNFDPARVAGLLRGYEAMVEFIRFVAAIRDQGVNVAVVLSPNEAQVTPEMRAELASRFAVRLIDYDLGLPAALFRRVADHVDPEIPIADLTAAFARGIESGRDLYLGRNTHWSADGNRLAAECITRFLGRSWFGVEPAAPSDCDAAAISPTPAQDVAREQIARQYLEPLLARVLVVAKRVDLRGMTPTQRPARFAITSINGVDFDALGTDHAVPEPSDGTLSVAGWAIVARAPEVADGVAVEVDGEHYSAEYGMARADVAEHFGDPELRRSGYSVRVPLTPASLRHREVTFRLKVIGPGRATFDRSGPITVRWQR